VVNQDWHGDLQELQLHDIRFLEAKFEPGQISQPIFTAITYGAHTPLIPIRKWPPEERKSSKDKLRMDAKQYSHEILEQHLIPVIFSLHGTTTDHPTIEDGLKSHTAKISNDCRQA
jgi:hypothetical protein